MICTYSYLCFLISSAVGYEALTKVLSLKSSFESILDYVEYPLPAICYQAVKVTSWFYLFSAALSAQNWCDDDAIAKPTDKDYIPIMCNTTVVPDDSMSSSADQYWWFFKVCIHILKPKKIHSICRHIFRT